MTHSERPATNQPVVTGVSRSPTSTLGVSWAADAAAPRHLPLRLVHALEWPPGADPHPAPGTTGPRHTWSAHYRAAGDTLLLDAIDFVADRWPDLEVQTRVEDGPRTRVLAEQGPQASLLVVGAKRLTMVEHLLTGSSLGATLSAHAGCPVAVVRELEHPAEDPPVVVVGVDGSELSRDAVGVAFEEAALHGGRLRAVEARFPYPEMMAGGGRERLIEEARAELSAATAGWRERYPDVEVEYVVDFGNPVRLLSRESKRARCLVVGTRGRGGFRGMLLGSVSQALVHQAPSPVLVVPPRR